MSNKCNGNNFEKSFARVLGSRPGSWVHIITDNANGQPFDIIAVTKTVACAYDCKLCKGDVFALSRVEVNQRLAFEKFSRAGGLSFLAICFGSEPDTVYCINFDDTTNMQKQRITLEEAKELADSIFKLCDDRGADR